MCDQIVVSVICNTFNHGPYVREALDGFVRQKTKFKYEVLVHDDASTDNTAKIIHEYETNYPNLIRAIYQNVNQYSQGINIEQKFHLPRARGQYIALCEGDDYWTDPYKLQKQVDALEKHPSIDICAHGTNMLSAKTNKIIGTVCPCSYESIFDVGDVISGGGDFVATSSLLYRRSLMETPPDYRKKFPYDYSLQIAGSMRGGMLYLPDIMSVYRVAVPGSWSERIGKRDFYVSEAEKFKKMLDMVNVDSNGQYSDIIKKRKMIYDFSVLEAMGKYKELKNTCYHEIFNSQPCKWKWKLFIKEHFDFIYRCYKKER